MQSRVEVKAIDAPVPSATALQEGKRSGTFTRQSRWILASREELNGGAIAWSEICGSECIARLLSRKGFRCVEEVENFLRPRLSSLSDPFLLPQMETAVSRILAALDQHERIVLFGDYDVDGVTSLALLAEMLRAYGGAPELFLPLRMEEGYGLSRESVERCLEQYRPQLLMAVDCGTASVTEIAELKRRGVDVIVLDHHEPKSALPNCVAILNPKVMQCGMEYLCSVGVVFKLCHALLKTRPLPGFDLKSKLDLVALGTVADIVPLRGENRVLVQRGAIEIARTLRIGLRKLMQVAGVRAPILPEDIGYRLGPRLNAAGRLSTAEKSLRLLLTQDEGEAAVLAAELDQQNRERQQVETEIFVAATDKINGEFDPARDAAIVAGARGWHPGVLGIVASRIVRKYHRPAIVIGFDEKGIGKGSGRSIEGLNMVEALNRCADSLDKYGGHEMAAGLAVREENFDRFAERFRSIARELLSEEALQPCLRLDHELAFTEVDVEFLRWHEMLQPFGNGNPQPLFFAREIEPVAPPRVVNEKHLIFRLRQGDHHRRAVYFDGMANQLPPPPWDIAFRIRADEYGGETLVAMQIEAVRQAAPIE
ncbi:MAG: single-stranded-DNA-specific exonuclease RecJ [Verrucomicrobia bacterium]|nr:MAG: single-stranded-DNA-specific exonuclease RecJ [Verrucomicrobiota bacterium]PYL44536.1 MAG: single-stranded-DNA-specific exonuclease RecJ [Verrucomicrobiota bacterium]